MTAAKHPRSLVSLKFPRRISDLAALAKSIVHAMTGNASFPSPEPPLPTISAAVVALDAAQTMALTRARGTASIRDDKRLTLVGLLEQLQAYIQKTADEDLETSASVIQSAGLGVRRPPARSKRTFSARPGTLSGTVKVFAELAGRRASYAWQFSTDAGKTWTSTASSLQAKTTISGLQPGATVHFRYRAVTKAGESDWSQPTSMIVR
jgi:hypothetical protein